jgi:hypothetical protein
MKRLMKGKSLKGLMIVLVMVFFAASNVSAMMGGGGDTGSGGSHMGSGTGHGMGYGTGGVGGMITGMMRNTISHGYLDILDPLTTPNEARAVIQAFIDSVNSDLQISELWEYGSVYKAELSDINGAKAFDLIADKFTGAVSPEMGLSMMFNASYGKGLYKLPFFRRNLNLSPEQATNIAQTFVNNNSLGYTLGTPEIYPGYYKFHTTMADSNNFGMDIMVNGYNGGVWMNTLLGLPSAKYQP